MKQTPLNHYSLKRIQQLNAEVPERLALCRRASGTPILRKVTLYRKHIAYPVTTVECTYGVCECGCGHLFPRLYPHEEPFRSQGGKVSLKDSKMVSPEHHRIEQHNDPVWSRKGEGN